MSEAQEVNRIAQRFAKLKADGETALIPFLTAGDPDLETTEALILAMAESGADVIELGVPFSDPTAEGPTIQRSSLRALKQGTSLRGILQLVDRIRDRVEQPIILMGYANPFYALSAAGFAEASSAAGVDGVIVPDLPPEEGDDLYSAAEACGVAPVLLAAPASWPSPHPAAAA